MKQQSLKLIEKKLARKKAELQTAIESCRQLETRIHELHEEIENLQAARLENIFQHIKKEALKEDLNIEYVALRIPNDFIVGYGLDYDKQGRQLRDIYTLVQE